MQLTQDRSDTAAIPRYEDKRLENLLRNSMKVTFRTVTGTSFSLDLEDKSKVRLQHVATGDIWLHSVRTVTPDCFFESAGIRCQGEGSARKRRCFPGGTSSTDLSGQSKATATTSEQTAYISTQPEIKVSRYGGLRFSKMIQHWRRIRCLRMASWLLWSPRYLLR